MLLNVKNKIFRDTTQKFPCFIVSCFFVQKHEIYSKESQTFGPVLASMCVFTISLKNCDSLIVQGAVSGAGGLRFDSRPSQVIFF